MELPEPSKEIWPQVEFVSLVNKIGFEFDPLAVNVPVPVIKKSDSTVQNLIVIFSLTVRVPPVSISRSYWLDAFLPI